MVDNSAGAINRFETAMGFRDFKSFNARPSSAMAEPQRTEWPLLLLNEQVRRFQGPNGLAYALHMPRVVVRLLLVLCLILNGIGNAMAAVAVPATMSAMSQHMQTKVDATEAELPSAGACDHADTPVSPLVVAGPSTSEDPHPAGCGEECCFQGACQCQCMQGAHAALLDVPAVPALAGRTGIASVFPAGHAAPLLHIAFRPPIG